MRRRRRTAAAVLAAAIAALALCAAARPVAGPAGDGAGELWIPVVAVLAAAGVALLAFRGRRPQRQPVRTSAGRGATTWPGKPKQPTPLTPLPELDAQAGRLLAETDDAVRTSREDVGFAAAQVGDEAAKPFWEAVEYARSELTSAFRLRQKLDDAYPEDDETRRQMLDEILSRCTQANRRLDAESEAFDRLRALEADTARVLESAEATAAALPGRIGAAENALTVMGRRYAQVALEPVADHPAEARDRLLFARTCLDRARAAIGSDHGRAAVCVRAAEGALDQAAILADSVTRRERELRAADAALPVALAEAEADLAGARGLSAEGASEATDARAGTRPAADGDTDGAVDTEAVDLRARIAHADTELAAVREQLAVGRPDPVAALRRVREAGSALDASPEEAEVQRARARLDQTLLVARSEVAAAGDVVTTHRGAIGSRARTRLTEAERRLRQAESRAVTDLPAALAHAREADRLARESLEYARQDVRVFEGHGPATDRGTDGGTGGAVLGGIIFGELLGGGPNGGYGFGGYGGGLGGGDLGGGPGSFGGGETRGRMGGGRS